MKLTEKELDVIKMRFGIGDVEPMTLEQIGTVLGVTRERVRQIETKVLAKLPNSGKVTWQVNKTRRLVRNADLQGLMQRGLLEHLDQVQQEIGKVHYKIADTWFLPSK